LFVFSAAVAASGSPLISRHRRYSSANSISLGETELVPAANTEQVLLSAGEYGLHVRLISASDLELEKGQLMSADPLVCAHLVFCAYFQSPYDFVFFRNLN
jgi:hypothetical protein